MTDPLDPAPEALPPTAAAPPPAPAAPPPPVVTWATPASSAAAAGPGRSRPIAALLALFLGWLGIHKFYLGKTLLGVIYLIFFWTGIPGFIAWIESMVYLATSDESWAAKYGGPVKRSNGAAIGCLWLIAILPFLSIFALIALIFLGSQVSIILSKP